MAVEPSEREARRTWAVAAGVRVHEGVKIDGPIWANWEKHPTNIVVGVEKGGSTIVVRGATGIEKDTKGWDVRRGVNVTCTLDGGGSLLVASSSLTLNSWLATSTWLAVGSYEPSPIIAFVHCHLAGGVSSTSTVSGYCCWDPLVAFKA